MSLELSYYEKWILWFIGSYKKLYYIIGLRRKRERK